MRSAVVYAAGALQGFAFTLLPALAPVFAQAPYHIGPRAFGELFVPLTAGAIAGAFLTPFLAERSSMVGVLRLGIVANVAALLALIASFFVPSGAAFALLLADGGALGLGFGLNFSAVNELASALNRNSTAAVTLANVLTGLGTALTPIVAAPFIARNATAIWPGILAAAFLLTLAGALAWRDPHVHVTHARVSLRISRTLLLFAVAGTLYALCEGAFSSWATTFARERGFSTTVGETALSVFWFALAGTRLLAAAFSRVLAPRTALAAFPLLIALAFAALPFRHGTAGFVGGFLFGGVACSIVFPYAMSLALAAMPQDADRVSGVMVAALMVGEGLGTFAIGTIHNDGVSLTLVYRWCAAAALALWIVAMLARSASPVKAHSSSS